MSNQVIDVAKGQGQRLWVKKIETEQMVTNSNTYEYYSNVTQPTN